MTDTRSSALFKRAEQLKRWEESDTNRQSASPKKASKIKFSSGCVFLAACTAGDKEEVLRLLKLGADINTVNVDGLTALHQACIDDNLDMVEFLVSRGADVDRGDNEGWTPLHATASCGFISIARFLLESGANVAAVNYDGELPVDIAESDKMEEILQKVINEKGVDCDAARNAEVNSLLADAKKWVATGYIDMQDPKTGGTPLHVAAAKGYLEVATVLLEECGVDPDCVDFDGWTPLHAAALWGQKEAAAALIKHGADMDIKNYSGQTCVDLVEPSIASWLEEARGAAAGSRLNNNNNNKHKRWPAAPLNPPSSKLKRVELQITNHNDNTTNENKKNTTAEIIPKLSDGKPPKGRAPSPTSEPSSEAPPTENNSNSGDEPPSWRRSASLRNKLNNEPTRDVKSNITNNAPADDTVLRRTHSFENDKTFYQRYCDVTARIKASSCPSIPPPAQSMSAIERLQLRKKSQLTPQEPNTPDTNEEVERRVNSAERRERDANTWAAPPPVTTTTAHTTVRSSAESLDSQNSNSTSQSSTPPSATPTKLSPGNIFKNFFKSFVPPVRDEESETQRKAHAKRVRETRRSTQGVTLDEIKSAEQLVKKKPNNGVSSDTAAPAPEHAPGGTRTDTAATQLTAPAAADPFELEDASGASSPRPASPRLPAHAAHAAAADTTTVTLPLPRSAAVSAATTTALTTTPALPSAKHEKGEEEKEKDSSAERGVAASTQAALNVIQRRRRPKRRSTGVGNLEIDDIVNDRGGGGEVDSEGDASQSGSERTSEAGEIPSPVKESTSSPRVESAEREPDYRALWEASQKEVSRLRDLLTTSERQLRESRGTIARLTQVNQNSLTELEKREKRAMERKLSEMEEELKGHQALQAENQRLKDENGALIRVISKLSK